MSIQENFVTALDKSEIYLRKWLPEGNPRGIVQIAHGMTEHAGVYTEFIDALLKQDMVFMLMIIKGMEKQ